MPRSRSWSLESMTRSTTAWWARKAPVGRSIASTRVVLPWSTWATIATLRRSSRTAAAAAVGMAEPGVSLMGRRSVAHAAVSGERRGRASAPRHGPGGLEMGRLDEAPVEQLDHPIRDLDHHRVVRRDERGHALGSNHGPDSSMTSGRSPSRAGPSARRRGAAADDSARARAIATRCCSPPDSSSGRCFARRGRARRARGARRRGGRARYGFAPTHAQRHLDVLGGASGSGSGRTSGTRTRSCGAGRRPPSLVEAGDLAPVDQDASPSSARRGRRGG